jgi:hypothetical protein
MNSRLYRRSRVDEFAAIQTKRRANEFAAIQTKSAFADLDLEFFLCVLHFADAMGTLIVGALNCRPNTFLLGGVVRTG